MTDLLQKPYPYFFNLKRNLWMALGCGLFIWAMQALVINEGIYSTYFDMSPQLFAVVVGTITAVAVMVVFDTFPWLFISESQRENWTVRREIAIIALLLVVIACCNFTFVVAASREWEEALKLRVFALIFLNVVVIGMVPTAIITWIKYTINLRENLRHAEQNNARLSELLHEETEEQAPVLISIPSENQSETIAFELHELLFIASDGNYVEVYLRSDGAVRMKVYRASIQKLEDALRGFPFIVRTHRSYLVNILKVEHTTGNARNYQLTFGGVEQSVPVSRNRFDAFNEALQAQPPHVALRPQEVQVG